MYALWWNKPYGVERTVSIYATYDENIRATIVAIKRGWGNTNTSFSTDSQYLESYFAWRLRAFDPSSSSPPPDLIFDLLREIVFTPLVLADRGKMRRFYFRQSRWFLIHRDITTCITFYAAGTLFSALHIRAWNWDFPT